MCYLQLLLYTKGKRIKEDIKRAKIKSWKILKKIMDRGHSQLQSQLRTVSTQLKTCELANNAMDEKYHIWKVSFNNLKSR